MKIFLNTIFLITIFLLKVSAQSPVLPCCDAAQLINNILIEKNEFYSIGDFKVLGSPFLFGGDQMGTVYSSTAGIHDIKMRYNVYTQFLETTINSDKGMVSIDLENIDSFILAANKEHAGELKFISRSLFSAGKNGYLLVLKRGNIYSLYKFL